MTTNANLHLLLLDVRNGTAIEYPDAEYLHAAGLIAGSQLDAAGLVLTPEGCLALQAFEDVERAGRTVDLIHRALGWPKEPDHGA